MAELTGKAMGKRRVPTTMRPLSLRRAQCVTAQLSPSPADVDFISDAVDAKVRRTLRRHRHIVLPADCAFPVTSASKA